MPEAKIRGQKREAVFARAGYRCEYCQTPVELAIQPFVTEHIIPLAKGGNNNLENLACACGGCNGHKSDKVDANDPVEDVRYRLYNPRADEWYEHFAWDANFTHVVGITGIGRATADTLRLNRPGLVNIRRLMILGGLHPL